ncbi:MAG: chorismate mutase [Bacteroidales bacterium]
MTLAELRKAIDAIDERLVALLNERAAVALEIGRWKRARDLPVYDPRREAQVIGRARRQARRAGGPLDQVAVGRLFERIIDEARQLEMADAEARGGHAGGHGHGGRDGRASIGGAAGTRRRRAR